MIDGVLVRVLPMYYPRVSRLMAVYLSEAWWLAACVLGEDRISKRLSRCPEFGLIRVYEPVLPK